MKASPSSPIIHNTSCSMTPNGANMSSRLRRNSLVSDHEDMMLLREKLTRIAVGRRHDAIAIDAEEEEEKERRRSCSTGSAMAHFKVFSSLPLDRPSTPPSSPQPRDVLRKQLMLKQSKRRESGGMEREEEEMIAMEDADAVHSPPPKGHMRSPRGRLSIPGHLRILSPFSVLNKHPEGFRKRKSIHVDVTEEEQAEQRGSMKKTASQINILAATAGKLSRSHSVGGDLYQTFGTRQRHEQDHDMEDAECKTQPEAAQKILFRNKHGQLSACT